MTASFNAPASIFFFIFLMGLITGSFLNVVIYRLPRGESLLKPRSRCVQCKSTLNACDLFPLFSFLLLKGRCRYCGNPISGRYPLVELLTALLFSFCFYYFGFSPFFGKYVVIFSLLLAITFIDLEKGIIPDRLVLAFLLWSIAWQLLFPVDPIMVSALGLLAGGGLFYLIAVLSKGGMGGGDIKLMAVLGFSSGWPLVFIVFLLSFLLGSLAGVILLAFKQKTRKDPLPFAPFLSLAFFITTFWGFNIWNWYHSLYF